MKQPSFEENKLFVGKRNCKMEVTIIYEDGSFQTVCDCGTVNIVRKGRAFASMCRECNTTRRSRDNQPFSRAGAEVREHCPYEEALIEDYFFESTTSES